jgi:hypothetical protein
MVYLFVRAIPLPAIYAASHRNLKLAAAATEL